MRLPEGGGLVKLLKSLYGLKQAGRIWNELLNAALLEFGFQRSKLDPCLYYDLSGDSVQLIIVYVDDLIIATSTREQYERIKELLESKFRMKFLGELRWCLGMRVTRDHAAGTLTLDQEVYVRNVLDRFHMEDSKTVSTPQTVGQPLSLSMCPSTEEEKADMANIPFRSAVGAILYASTRTRPDIATAVGDCCRYVENPGRAHWQALKRIMRYLRGTPTASLVYSKDSEADLVCYVDADWAGDVDTRRSTTGYLFILCGAPVCWESKRQRAIAQSTCEAEFIAAANAARANVWLRNLMEELRISDGSKPTCFYEDNQGCIALVRNPIMGRKSKHIELRYHFIREEQLQGRLEMQYCPTASQLADILTKGVDRTTFLRLREGLGIQIRTPEQLETALMAAAFPGLEWECWKWLDPVVIDEATEPLASAVLPGARDESLYLATAIARGVPVDVSRGYFHLEVVDVDPSGMPLNHEDSDRIASALWEEVKIEPRAKTYWETLDASLCLEEILGKRKPPATWDSGPGSSPQSRALAGDDRVDRKTDDIVDPSGSSGGQTDQRACSGTAEGTRPVDREGPDRAGPSAPMDLQKGP
jgi:hypothetical protein